MSVLKLEQLLILVNYLKDYGLGGQLQDISLNESHLFLQHYIKQKNSHHIQEDTTPSYGEFTVGIELRPLSPRLGYFFGPIPKKKYLVKPIVLFLKAHARNLRLSEVRVDREKGRVVTFVYVGTENRFCEIEVRLIPHGVNVIISSGGKSISLFPVKELPTSIYQPPSEDIDFNLEAYLNSWFEGLSKAKTTVNTESLEEAQERKRKKEIQKKETIIEKLEKDLLELNKPWRAVGEYLKGQHQVDAPSDWQEFVNPSLSVSANMQICFDKHKLQEKRKEQMLERIQHLREEINKLQESSGAESVIAERPIRSLASELLSKAKAKGRKLQLGDGMEAVFGKSAKDNLALLRRAQAWDLWLHLRDLPGSHLIIRRARNKNVDHASLLEAARWLLNETLGKNKVITGDRYDIIVTECRFVKPIKGDRLGRVTFQNEMTLTLRV